jgi:hypothetical protein
MIRGRLRRCLLALQGICKKAVDRRDHLLARYLALQDLLEALQDLARYLALQEDLVDPRRTLRPCVRKLADYSHPDSSTIASQSRRGERATLPFGRSASRRLEVNLARAKTHGIRKYAYIRVFGMRRAITKRRRHEPKLQW